MKSTHLAVKTLKTLVNLAFILVVSIEFSTPTLAQTATEEHLVSNSIEDYFGETGQTEAPHRNGGGTHCRENPDLILSTSWENSTDEVRQRQPEEHLDDRHHFERDGHQQCGDRHRVSGATR